MTKAMVRERDFAKVASLDRRRLATLLSQMAADIDQERGERLQELRRGKGNPPQPLVAAAVGVSLRTYQSWEAGGGIRFDNREALAKYFGVSISYIVGGETPDVIGSLNGERTQLDRIEEKLDEALSRAALPAEALDLLRQIAEAGPSRRPGDGESPEAGGASPS